MSNISSALLSTSDKPSGGHFLEIERTEDALVSWLQTQAREILSEPLFITASVLFAWVDLHDLRAVLELSLTEVQGSWMKERMYRAQEEVSLFGKAIVNLCEEMNARRHPTLDLKMLMAGAVGSVGVWRAPAVDLFGFRDCFQPTKAVREKCNEWLIKTHAIQVSDGNKTLLDSQLTAGVPQPYESLLSAMVDSTSYRTYMNASLEEFNEPLVINHYDNFKAKEYKTMDGLKSDLLILYLKKQRAQAEVDMFYDAIERTSEFKSTGDDTSSGIPMACESSPPANDYPNNSFDNWFSTSSVSSDTSALP